MLCDRWSNDSQRLDGIVGAVGGLESGGINYFVDGDAGSNSNDGTSWDTAKATITAAVALMVDNDSCYVGGSTYSEAVTTPSGTDRCRLIGVSTSKEVPLWQSGAGGSSHLVVVGAQWEIAGFRFHGGNSNTVAFLEIDTLTPLAGNAPNIHNCYFTVGAATGPAIRFHGGCYDPIINNNEFFGFTSTGSRTAALCGSNHANSTQNPTITNNTFTECVAAINMQCSDGLFKGNNFGRYGKTNDCSVTMHLVNYSFDDGTHAGDGANIITQNTFDWKSSELTSANGFYLSDTDLIVGNFCKDGLNGDNSKYEENPNSAFAEVYWVDADTGSDTNNGLSPERAFASVEAAITANNTAHALDGDPQRTMYIHSKTYTENLTAFPKNCTVIGIGGKVRLQGYHSTGAAQNSHWHNIQFRSSENDTPIITIASASHGIEFHECVFDSTATISECILFATNSYVSDSVIEKCRIGYDSSAPKSPDIAIHFAGIHAQRGKVVDNQIYSTGIGIQIDVTMISNNFMLIKDNVITNRCGSDAQMAVGISDLTGNENGGLYIHNFISAVDAFYFGTVEGDKSRNVCIGNHVVEATVGGIETSGS